MSWFDTTGFATLAKSALKEAQKTIDKALDIQDEDKGKLDTSPSGGDVNAESFFNSWGMQASSTQSSPGTTASKELMNSVTMAAASGIGGGGKMTSSASLWGSFTGSFFDNQAAVGHVAKTENRQTSYISAQPKKNPSRSLSLDLKNTNECSSSNNVDKQGSVSPGSAVDFKADDAGSDGEQIREEIRNYPAVEVVMRKRDKNTVANRLSVISSESDRRSTESCEVLGSTPDSDPTSISTSSSVAKLRQSGSFESVEVLTSPSSVDVLGSNSSITSPGDLKFSSDSVSPVGECEGVEIIPEDEDDVSVEDSYTSASENTLTLTTVLEHSNLMLKSTSSLDTSFSESVSPRESISRPIVGMVLTHAVYPATSSIGESTSMAVAATAKDNVEVGENSNVNLMHRGKEESSGVVVTEAPRLSLCEPRLSEPGSDHDNGPNSSCEEGTIMGSSDEGINLRMVGSSNARVTNMLAEAMVESPNLIREQSPISSERSDLVKIGSSEHTSGDELETATSSDIEIISSPTPNGSSTASRQSPSKSAYKSMNLGKILTSKVRGHHREPSETSSGGSDECSEVDKLLKKIGEMTELLEARESKLIDLSKINADLHESNIELKSQLERQNEAQDLKHISEEFTQRLAALERKFQQAIREKELLRKQLDQAKSLVAEQEGDAEKDEIIADLRSEGEKLSKQQLTLSTTLKKLRASEKENQKTITALRDQLNNVTQELERSKKQISAKEELERSHIEAVHNLKQQLSQLEKECLVAKNQVTSLTNTLISTQNESKQKDDLCKKLEAKIKEGRIEMENKVRKEMSAELEAAMQQVLTLQTALKDLRQQLINAQKQHSLRESQLRREITECMHRAERAESKVEEQSEAIRIASEPLARQIQALTEGQVNNQAIWVNQQQQFHTNIAELEAKVSSLSVSETNVREQYEAASGRVAALSDKVDGLMQQNNALLKELSSSRESLEKLKVLKNSEAKKYQTDKDRLCAEVDDKKREITSLKEVLSIERTALEAEKRKSSALQEQLKSYKTVVSPQISPRSSPTLSFGPSSVISDSFMSPVWPNFGDDNETGSTSGRLYDVLRPANNTTFLETLQSQLKQKEGELQQLQWEVARLDLERNTLREELCILTAKLDEQAGDVSSLALLRTQYDALLQMYGEKLEESQELRMDLQDVKDMYKAQIDELLKKEPSTPAP